MNQAHLHLLLVHFPVVGGIVALGLLLRAYFIQTQESIKIVTFITILVAISAGLAFATGEGAEHQIENLVSESAIESHESAATAALVSSIAAGGIAVLILLAVYLPRLARILNPLRHALLIALLCTVTLVGIAAQRGGAIRHTEITDATGGLSSESGTSQEPEGKRTTKDDD